MRRPAADGDADRPAHVPVLLERCRRSARAGPAAAEQRRGRRHARAWAGTPRRAAARCPAGAGCIGLDRDPQALPCAAERLAPSPTASPLVHAVYDDLADVLADLGRRRRSHGILFDLGVSSLQLDEADRGFAYAQDAPLDMRMDQTRGLTAADVLNTYAARRPHPGAARPTARSGSPARSPQAVVREREREPFTTLGPPRRARPRRRSRRATRRTGGHPAKRTFQALRIEVNGELDALAAGRAGGVERWPSAGRIVVLSYHSLEDRIVKRPSRAGARQPHPGRTCRSCRPSTRPPAAAHPRGRGPRPRPRSAANPRAASARLRAAERIRARERATHEPGAQRARSAAPPGRPALRRRRPRRLAGRCRAAARATARPRRCASATAVARRRRPALLLLEHGDRAGLVHGAVTASSGSDRLAGTQDDLRRGSRRRGESGGRSPRAAAPSAWSPRDAGVPRLCRRPGRSAWREARRRPVGCTETVARRPTGDRHAHRAAEAPKQGTVPGERRRRIAPDGTVAAKPSAAPAPPRPSPRRRRVADAAPAEQVRRAAREEADHAAGAAATGRRRTGAAHPGGSRPRTARRRTGRGTARSRRAPDAADVRAPPAASAAGRAPPRTRAVRPARRAAPDAGPRSAWSPS